MAIPLEIRKLKQWTHSLSKDELKRPTHHQYPAHDGLKFGEAKKKGLFRGMYVTEEDPYIMGDLDHVDVADPFKTLPMPLALLLQSNPPYMEVSPSGAGIRFFYRLKTAKEKQALSGNVFYARDMDKKREAQINFGPPWMTVTGKELSISSGQCPLVSLGELMGAFDIRFAVEKQKDLQAAPTAEKVSPFSEVLIAVKRLPINANPRIRRAYRKVFGHEYSHYDYWLKVLMALHDYGTRAGKLVECLDLANRWSSLDQEKYKGEADVTAKWRSFTEAEGKISYKTLFALFNRSTLRWPKPRKQTPKEKEQGKPRLPINGEIVNFRALLNFYGLELHRDAVEPNGYYLTGDEDILQEHFAKGNIEVLYDKYWGMYSEKSLTPAMQEFCQHMGFTQIAAQGIKQHVAAVLSDNIKTFDVIKTFFDTPLEELPKQYQFNKENTDKSTVDEIFDCLTIDYSDALNLKIQEHLFKKYIEVWLMGIARGLDHVDHPFYSNNNCLVLMGPEQCRKTTFFKVIMPNIFKRHVRFTPHSFGNEASLRDLYKIASTSRILVFDEIDKILDRNTESNFKRLLDNTPQTFIDKYEVLANTVKPIAIYGATTNMRELDVGPTGARRLFMLPVTWVDTDRVQAVCIHRVINDLREKVTAAIVHDECPWLLSEQELIQQRTIHHKKRVKDSVELRLEEMFDFDQTLDLPVNDGSLHSIGVRSIQTSKTERALTTRQVRTALLAYDPDMNVSDKALIRSLRSLCGAYTGTENKKKYCDEPKCVIERGLAKQQQYSRWILPPRHRH